ncbi:MAG: signal peptidase I [Eubacteriales bacterium]|nr:signal peptidase I [Eubacteriales bacterium]
MRVLRWLIDLLLLLYMGVLLILTAPGLAGWQLFAVTSASMEPGIPTGAMVYVKKTEFSKLKEGDVITFLMEDMDTVVTHRIVKIDHTEQRVSTKGDANRLTDAGWTRVPNILGKVCIRIPFLGYAAILMKNVWGKLLLAAMLLWLTALEYVTSSTLRTIKGRERWIRG